MIGANVRKGRKGCLHEEEEKWKKELTAKTTNGEGIYADLANN